MPANIPIMNVITRSKMRLLGVVFLIAATLSGCRTYGGYGTEAATYAQIQEANSRFAEALSRAQAGTDLIVQAAAQHPALDSYVGEYEALVTVHETLLEEHQTLAEGLSPSSDYRDLHRAYGNVLAEQRTLQNQYQTLYQDIKKTVEGLATVEAQPEPEGRYAYAPQFYDRITQQTLTLRSALRSTPPAQSDSS